MVTVLYYLNTFEDLTFNIGFYAPSPWYFVVLYKQTYGLLCYVLYLHFICIKNKKLRQNNKLQFGSPQGRAKRRGQMRQVL